MEKTILSALRPLVLTLVFSSISVFSACTSATADNPVTKHDDHARKALLIVLDGWGIGDKSKSDVIYQTPTPYIDYMNANYPHAELQASGEYVGLPDGQMGNSETGHLLKLIDIAKEYGIGNCYLHCFMDGRDTDPRAGKGFIADLQKYIDEAGVGTIATAIGRYYAMDRDKHWDQQRHGGPYRRLHRHRNSRKDC